MSKQVSRGVDGATRMAGFRRNLDTRPSYETVMVPATFDLNTVIFAIVGVGAIALALFAVMS